MEKFFGKLKLGVFFICFLVLFSIDVSSILAAEEDPRDLLNFDKKTEKFSENGESFRLKEGVYGKGILIDNLEDIGAESIGIINDEQGGLGINLWHGSNRELVINLLRLLPDAHSSQVLRNLTTRLLLTNAIAPIKSGISNNNSNTDLNYLRALKLFGMGEVDLTLEFTNLVLPRSENPLFPMLYLDSLFLVNDLHRACSAVEKFSLTLEDLYLKQSLVFCQIMAGEKDLARLSIQLLRENNTDVDFFNIANLLLSEESRKIHLADYLNPLKFAMMRTGNIPIVSNTLADSKLAILRVISMSPNVDLKDRISAAEKAAMSGILSPEELLEVYSGINLTSDDLKDASIISENEHDYRNKAILLIAAQNNESTITKAEILSLFFSKAHKDGFYLLSAQMSKSELLKIEPSIDLLWFADQAFNALLVSGENAEAVRWLRFLENNLSDPIAYRSFLKIWPLAKVSGDKDLYVDGKLLKEWIKFTLNLNKPSTSEETSDKEMNKNLSRKVNLVLVLLDALGESSEEELWQILFRDFQLQKPDLYQEESSPNIGLINALRKSAQNSKLGETVLFAILSSGSGNFKTLNQYAIAELVYSLTLIGLDLDARKLAIEIAAQSGI